MSRTESSGPGLASARDRLRAARAVQRARAGRPTPSDIAYAIYAGFLAVLISGSPLVRAIILGLLDPAAQDALRSLGSGLVGLVATLAGLALLSGAVRGPAVLTPFLADHVAGSDLPRRLVLRPGLVRSALVTAVVLAAATGVAVTSLLLAGNLGAEGAVRLIVAALIGGPVIAGLRLWGQALPGKAVYVLTVCVVALGVVGLLAGPASPLSAVAVAVIAIIGLAAAIAAPSLLDLITGASLRDQAARWDAVGTLAGTGDVAGALGRFRAPPKAGRRLRLPLPRSLPAAVVMRDVIGALRSPGRLAVGVIGTLTGGVFIGLSGSAAESLSWLPATAGALLAFLAAGVWADGFRFAADAAGRPALLGLSTSRLVLLHAILPLTMVVVLSALGATAVVVLAGASPAFIAWSAALGVLAVALRAFDAAKGPLPIGLLMPVPTPLGDLSLVSVVAWQLDSVLLAVISGGLLTWLLGTAPASAAIGLVLVIAAVIGLAYGRFAKAARPERTDLSPNTPTIDG